MCPATSPIGIGEVVRSRASARWSSPTVRATRWATSSSAPPGQDYALAARGPGHDAGAEGDPAPVVLNVFGVTGMTAYFGLLEVGALKEGDTVVVSGAAGATGRQSARSPGSRVRDR